MRTQRLALLALAMFATLGAFATAEEYNVATTTVTGQKLIGPRTVTFFGINAIKYSATLGVNATTTAGPDVSTVFSPQKTAAAPVPSSPATGAHKGIAPLGGAATRATPQPCTPVQGTSLHQYECLKAMVAKAKTDIQQASSDADGILDSNTYTIAQMNDALKGFLDDGSYTRAVSSTLDATTYISNLDDLLNGLKSEANAPQPQPPSSPKAMPAPKPTPPPNKLGTLKATIGANPGPSAATARPTPTPRPTPSPSPISPPVSKTSLTDAIANFGSLSSDIAALKSFLPTLRGLSPASFQRTYAEACSGLFNSSRETKLTLTLTDRSQSDTSKATTTSDVTVVCPAPVVLGAGFIFSSLKQQTFSAQTNNAPGNQNPGATVIRDTSSEVRPIFFSFAHFRVCRVCETESSGAFFSVGTGVNSTSSSTTIDFAAGPTFEVYRSLFLTVGAHLGQVTDAAPGFTTGTPVSPSMKIPTVTNQKVGWFLGLTYGK